MTIYLLARQLDKVNVILVPLSLAQQESESFGFQ